MVDLKEAGAVQVERLRRLGASRLLEPSMGLAVCCCGRATSGRSAQGLCRGQEKAAERTAGGFAARACAGMMRLPPGCSGSQRVTSSTMPAGRTMLAAHRTGH